MTANAGAMDLSFLGSDDDIWLDQAACAGLPIESFFVQAGHVIDEEVLNVCRACPVRRDCLRHSYNPRSQHHRRVLRRHVSGSTS